MSKVTITPVKGQTSLINKFPNSDDKGFLLLKQTKLELGSQWARPQIRTCLMKGDLETLQLIVQESKSQGFTLPGRIVTHEFVRSQVPAKYKTDFYDQREKDESIAEQDYLKTTGGEDPIQLTLEGEEIFMFRFYDGSGTIADILVRHDNGQEISEMMQERREIAANLPGENPVI